MIHEPRMPFIQIPDWVLIPQGFFGGTFPPAPFSFKPFGTLVAVGVYVGAWLALRHGAGFVRRVFIAVVAALIVKTGWDAFLR